ncbi:hypothetical protein FEM48_Zijuj05G0170600 [Ziziphus jujuba var. spinosa]|uniref:Leucine-rich repeat-containing N-terminal plant-type domain-containing protein n=1 Tax=Ziziphus jujuba var. spinosa TaxID=714518 RepID=A0A978VG18_ZIZJJ|nr:hypothetical protein FEM48_Zijuj05G0170600 [Ziziphus jujuba var. spinosa]
MFWYRKSLLFSLLCLFVCSTMVLSQLSSTQNDTMVSLYESLKGSSVPWDINKQPNPCSWKGISCNSTSSSITGISVSEFSLSSSDFLPIVCKLDSLQMLDVSNNRFASIPVEFIRDCGKIDGLKRLDFSKNRLVGKLPKFDGFVGLEFLDLSYNSLSGNISLELEGLVGLKRLNLSFNDFTGSLPTQLGNSKVLEELQVSMNRFDGIIPEGIIDYRNVRLLVLSQNNLAGSIPDKIGELSKLEVLILSSNKLTGEIPKSLSNITTLLRFAADQNQFFGLIPSDITKFLKILDLSYNLLDGSIPSDILSPQNLQAVDLSNNRLKGSISTTNMSRSLISLRLGSNQLDGKIPASFEGLKNLMYLELDSNNFTESIPVELGSCQSLALLDLSQNGLTGALPGELGNLKSLQVLKLQSNRLTGEIPDEITQLLNLSTLDFSWNSLIGSIPPSISRLRKLTSINLQGNHLSGSVPDSLANMTTLMELQLGKNQLSGYIPKMPPNLQIALNLSSNLFKGPIPKNLDELSWLEVLDLSNNNFSGEIPEFLTRLKSLTRLILTNNSLSGVIPNFASFVNLETSGNKITKSNTSPASEDEEGSLVELCLLLHQFLLTSRELDLEWFSSRWRSTRRQIWSKICDIEDERNFEVFWQINMTGVEHAIAELFKAIKEYKDIMEPDESLGCLNLQTKVKNRYPDNLYWSCRMKKYCPVQFKGQMIFEGLLGNQASRPLYYIFQGITPTSHKPQTATTASRAKNPILSIGCKESCEFLRFLKILVDHLMVSTLAPLAHPQTSSVSLLLPSVETKVSRKKLAKNERLRNGKEKKRTGFEFGGGDDDWDSNGDVEGGRQGLAIVIFLQRAHSCVPFGNGILC